MVFFAAIIYSAAVSVAIYGFWTYLIRFVPEMRDAGSRLALVGVMALGSAMIIAMSSWLNAAALAGSAAVEQHLAITLEGYTGDLDQANTNALAALSLLPDIQRAAERFARLADDERNSGALTGTSGSGSVVQLLSQMSAQMRELETTIETSRETVRKLFSEGQTHLATMRGLVSGSGAIQPRSDEFAREAVALAGVVSALQQTSVAAFRVPRRRRPLGRLHRARGQTASTPDLAGRQDQVMATVRASVEAQSKALSDAAGEILAQPKVAERRYVPLTSAEAVLRYARDFIPSWAGAISIDLLPAVLVAIMAVVHGAMRRGEDEIDDADRITAGDIMRSLRYQEIFEAQQRRAAEIPRWSSPHRRMLRLTKGCRPSADAPEGRERHAAVDLGSKAGRSVTDPAPLAGDTTPRPHPIVRYLARFDDGEVLRWAFRGLLIGAIGVLATDLRDMSSDEGWFAPSPAPRNQPMPVLPPAVNDRRAGPLRRSPALRHLRRSGAAGADVLHARRGRRPAGAGHDPARKRGEVCRRDRRARRICEDRLARIRPAGRSTMPWRWRG